MCIRDSSKAAAEIAINSYCQSYFSDLISPTRIARARAGNVIGGGDWSPNRLIPDCARAWLSHSTLHLRSPDGVRPWQHVLEALNGYLLLGFMLNQNPSIHSHAFNFGPSRSSCVSVKKIAECLTTIWPNFSYVTSPSDTQIHETITLALNTDKAYAMLHWTPLLAFEDTISLTANWYSSVALAQVTPYNAVSADIMSFMKLVS